MHCAKNDFPHPQYAVYLHAIVAQHVVKCGIDAVTWCDVMANHRRAAHSIPHFTFRILHAAVPHFTHRRGYTLPGTHWNALRHCFWLVPGIFTLAPTCTNSLHNINNQRYSTELWMQVRCLARPLVKCGCADVRICRFWNSFGWNRHGPKMGAGEKIMDLD